MKCNKFLLIFLIILIFLPIKNAFGQLSNVGFIQSNIWYSKDSFAEGDKIKIYTVVFNPDQRELSGTVIFFDNDVVLGTKKFTTPGKTVKDVSVDWTVTAGDHSIFAKIEGARFLISEGKYEDVYLADNKTETSKKTIAKKIIAAKENTTDNKEKVSTENKSGPISTIDNFVKNNTPEVVTKTLDSSVVNLENFRKNLAETTNDTKEKIKTDLTKINKEKEINKDSNKNFNVNGPLKSVELFFLSLFAFVLKNKIIFYGLIILFAFFMLRYLWRLILRR